MTYYQFSRQELVENYLFIFVNITMRYYQFNRQELLQKAKKKTIS